MKRHQSHISADKMTAQQALDEIIQLEIELAEEIADIQDGAQKKIVQAESEVEKTQKNTLTEARAERDQLLKKGLAAAQKAARAHERQAEAAARQFQADGQQFIKEAASLVMDMVIPNPEAGSK